MEPIAATFGLIAAAQAAATELASKLQLSTDAITVEELEGSVDHDPGSGMLMALLPEESRSEARDVIVQHGGRHAPVDYFHSLQQEPEQG